MYRFSIRALMAVVLASAVALAALRNANEVWAAVMTILAVGLLGLAMLCAILRRGSDRALWSGCAIVGTTYLIVSLSPLRPRLTTTHLLEYVHARVAPLDIATVEVSRFDESSVQFQIVTSDGDVTKKTVPNSVYHSTPMLDLQISLVPPNRWHRCSPEQKTGTPSSASVTPSSLCSLDF